MRTINDNETHALISEGRATHFRVVVDRGTNDWINLSDLEGYDWVIGVEYGHDEDRPTTEAVMRFVKKQEGLNLAVLVASKLNTNGTLLDLGNPIKVEVAVMGVDCVPESSDWVEVFNGEIDFADWTKAIIIVRARDQSGLLVDTFIETLQVYGTDAGRAMELVIQDIIDDHINDTGLGAFTLYSSNGTGGTPFNAADSPGFLIKKYKGNKETVMASIRRVAQLIGADVRYMWHANTLAFQLVFVLPDRALSASGIVTFTGLPTATQAMMLNVTPITAVASGAGTDQFNIGVSATVTAANLAAAINEGTEKNNCYATSALGVVTIVWTPGLAGDSIVLTEAMSNTTVNGGGTLGGSSAGSDGKTTPDYTFGPDRYREPTGVKYNRADVRNAIRIAFTNPTDNTRNSVLLADNASIQKYRRRYFEMAEASTSQIDSFTEALNLAAAALADLREPDLLQTVPVPYFWPAEVTDLYRFEAHLDWYDADQDLGLRGVRHTLSAKQSLTTFDMRGKASGGRKRWLNIEGRPGIASPLDLTPDGVPTGAVTAAGMGSVRITYDDPLTMAPPIPDWTTTRLYGVPSTDSGYPDFTPSASNFFASGKQLSFVISDLIPGETYSFKLQVVDGVGNISATMAYVTQASQLVGPYHENQETQSFDQLLRNGDFNVFTLGDDQMPDFWFALAGVWGASDDIYFTTAAATGARALTMLTAGVTTKIRSEYIPIAPDDLLMIGILANAGATSEAVTDVDLVIWWHAANKAFISASTTSVTINGSSGGFEERLSGIFQAPSTARYCSVHVEQFYVSSTYTVNIDRIGLMRTSPQAGRERDTNFLLFHATANTYKEMNFNGIKTEEVGIAYSGSDSDAGTSRYTILVPGHYVFSASIICFTQAAAHELQTVLEYYNGSSWIELTGDLVASLVGPTFHQSRIVMHSPIVELEVGWLIRARARCNTAVAGLYPNMPQGPNVWISGKMLEKSLK